MIDVSEFVFFVRWYVLRYLLDSVLYVEDLKRRQQHGQRENGLIYIGRRHGVEETLCVHKHDAHFSSLDRPNKGVRIEPNASGGPFRVSPPVELRVFFVVHIYAFEHDFRRTAVLRGS